MGVSTKLESKPKGCVRFDRIWAFQKAEKNGEVAMYTRGISHDLAIGPFEKELKKREIKLMKPI